MLRAFIDESGKTPHGERSEDHFVLSAVVFDERNLEKADAMLDHLRRNTGSTHPRSEIHFNKIVGHGARRYMTHVLGTRDWLTIISVVVSKRLLGDGDSKLIEDVPAQYNYTFRYLLERLSWLAQSKSTRLEYTAAHLRGFPPERLSEYESALRALGDKTEIKWGRLANPAGQMVHPDSDPRLQLADIAASATAKAFEPDEWGLIERRYLRNLAPALYRSNVGNAARYGVKIHPTSAEGRPEYAWIWTLTSQPGETIDVRWESSS